MAAIHLCRNERGERDLRAADGCRKPVNDVQNPHQTGTSTGDSMSAISLGTIVSRS